MDNVRKEDVKTLEEVLYRFKKLVCNGKESVETQELIAYAEQAIDNLKNISVKLPCFN